MTNVPMTRPDAALAIHNTCHGHGVSWTLFDCGHIVLSAGTGLSISDDGGLTWSESYRGKNDNGEEVNGIVSLVKLDGKAIGATCTGASGKLCFCKSTDEGHTWSQPGLINPGSPAYSLQDTLLRTSSGRLICPVYMAIGQTIGFSSHHEQAPFVGGYLNGSFVSSDAHFYDPRFSSSFIYYSDDEGQTWQRNEDGELFVILGYGGSNHGAPEPTVCEAQPGKLMMMVRTRLGRMFQAWSNNNGQNWTRLQPTQLAASPAPAQLRTLPNGHLLCVFTQHSPEEIKQSFIRTRLSAAISRNGGGIWEHFQNVESLHEETHVEPGPIEVVRPAGGYRMHEASAFENDRQFVVPLPVGYGRWSYPSVLVLDDRVLISHSYGYHDETGNLAPIGYSSKMKVLPLNWFYSGLDPNTPSKVLSKLSEAPRP